jgi:hypothetical protein
MKKKQPPPTPQEYEETGQRLLQTQTRIDHFKAIEKQRGFLLADEWTALFELQEQQKQIMNEIKQLNARRPGLFD